MNANWDIPIIVYKKNNRPNKRASAEIAGIASKSVCKIIWIAGTLLTILKILPILSVRAIIPKILISIPKLEDIIIATIHVRVTTEKSNLFHASLK